MKKIILIIFIVFSFFKINITDLFAEEKIFFKEDISRNLTQKEIHTNKKSSPAIKEGEIIVKFKKNQINLKQKLGRTKILSFKNKYSLNEYDSIDNENIKLLKSENKTTAELLEELKNDPNVEYAEPNILKKPMFLPNDERFYKQWALKNNGDNGGIVDADIDADEMWDIESSENQEIIVAVIDTGVRYAHEDLIGQMWDGTNCVNENNIPIQGGCANHGWDFKDDDNNPDATTFDYCISNIFVNNVCQGETEDISAHGTFVGGIISAKNNNVKGITGLSSKSKIKIMALRFNLDTFSEIKAISFAKNNGAKIINASFGSENYANSEKNAIDLFPGLFIASAGNDGTNNDYLPLYPASYDNANVISVAATDNTDNLASFTEGGSNYGETSVDIAAPGKEIISVYKLTTSSYGTSSGTSFAAPYVSAASAMILSANPSLSVAQVKNYILENGDDVSSLSGKILTGKRLNAFKSLFESIRVPNPDFSLEEGSYSSAQTLSLLSQTPNTEIRYTLDGSEPSPTSLLYENNISINSTTTVKAMTTKGGVRASDIISKTYTIIGDITPPPYPSNLSVL